MITNYPRFCSEVEKYLIAQAKKHPITGSLSKYYTLNAFLPSGISAETLNCVLYHVAFESQDSTYGHAALKMKLPGEPDNMEPIIREILKDYDCNAICASYSRVEDLYDELENRLHKLNHPPVRHIKREQRYIFAKRILNASAYLATFSSYTDFKADILKHPGKSKAEYFAGKLGIKSAIALACNILKEIDVAFNMAKPDMHIVEVLAAVGEITLEADTLTNQLNAIDAMENICSKAAVGMNVFKLDRMLWLICTEQFYLDDNIKNSNSVKRNNFIKHIESIGLIS